MNVKDETNLRSRRPADSPIHQTLLMLSKIFFRKSRVDNTFIQAFTTPSRRSCEICVSSLNGADLEQIKFVIKLTDNFPIIMQVRLWRTHPLCLVAGFYTVFSRKFQQRLRYRAVLIAAKVTHSERITNHTIEWWYHFNVELRFRGTLSCTSVYDLLLLPFSRIQGFPWIFSIIMDNWINKLA